MHGRHVDCFESEMDMRTYTVYFSDDTKFNSGVPLNAWAFDYGGKNKAGEIVYTYVVKDNYTAQMERAFAAYPGVLRYDVAHAGREASR
jgi:hypothetical protein